MSSIVIRLRSRILRVAGIGPVSISTGSTPTVVWSTIRARGVTPSSSAFSRDMRSTAAAPSEICEELPAVIRPSSLKAGFSSARVSTVVPGRMPWSVETTLPVDRHGVDLALEPAFLDRALGALLGARADLVQPLAREAPLLGDHLGREALVDEVVALVAARA